MALVSLYGRALSGKEVKTLNETFVENDELRQTLGALITERPGDSGENVKWPAWHFKGDTLIQFFHMVDFYSTARQNRSFSVETWIWPDTAMQAGPARMVSASATPDKRNFTLGQQEDRLVFRVRTPLTGLNGSLVQVETGPVLNTEEFQHVVAVFHGGVSKLYVNGHLAGGSVHAFRDYFSGRLLGFGTNGLSQFMATWALFFPLALSGVALFRRTGWLVALLPPVLVEGYAQWVLGQPVDWVLIGHFVITLAAGIACGWILRSKSN
jgi:hypothetical protein